MRFYKIELIEIKFPIKVITVEANWLCLKDARKSAYSKIENPMMVLRLRRKYLKIFYPKAIDENEALIEVCSRFRPRS